jgi:hypothetical protein
MNHTLFVILTAPSIGRRQAYRLESDCHPSVFCSTSIHLIMPPAHSEQAGEHFVSRHSVVAFRTTGAALASEAAYVAATIDLYGRLWRELEQLSDVFASAPHCAVRAEESDQQLMMLRLELVVLLDACDSPEWWSMLGAERRVALRTTLESLLRTLGALPPDLDRCCALARAQDQLLDAVLAQYAVARLLTGSADDRAPARRSNP